MKVFDEDSFFGSGEREILTVPEVMQYLTKSEARLLEKLCDKAEQRKVKDTFSRGYNKAREITSEYKGDYNYPKYQHFMHDQEDQEDQY